MNKLLPERLICLSTATRVALKILFLAMLVLGTAVSVKGQGDMPSGTLGFSGNGPYLYTLTFSNAPSATSPIGSVWYAWIPGHFYLPGQPISVAAPAGWTANASGHSVQWSANSAAYDIGPGQSLSGFSYRANFTPAQLAAAPNSGLSDAYAGALQSDLGRYFTVQSVPEPSTVTLLILGATGLLLFSRRR